MATEPTGGSGDTSALTAADDCAITRPSADIAIPILDNDGIDDRPYRIQVQDPEGELWFTAAGEAVFRAHGEGAALDSFHYTAGYPDGSSGPATVFVLVNGEGALPAGALENAPLIAACSRATALETIKLELPGQPVPVPDFGVRVEVVVDAFAQAEIALTHSAFRPGAAKFITVQGGVVVFLQDGRVVFLAGADEVEARYLLLDEFDEPAPWSAAQVVDYAKGVADDLPPPQPRAELVANHAAFLGAPLGATPTETLAKTEFPFCGRSGCLLYEYQGDAYVMVGEALTAGLEPVEPRARFAELLSAWPDLESRPPILLAATDGAAPSRPEPDLAAFWLEQNPGDRVVVLEEFFARAGQPDPPELSIGESRFVPADLLLASAIPISLEGFPDGVRLVPPRSFPPREVEHGGGAGFRALDEGDVGEGLVPLLEQPPTQPPGRREPSEIKVEEPRAQNRPPVTEDDLAGLPRGDIALLEVLDNDFDPDPRDEIRIEALQPFLPGESLARLQVGSAHGNVLELPGGRATISDDARQIRFEPRDDFAGLERFAYTATDGKASSAPATVLVVVDNEPPVAADDLVRSAAGQAIEIDVLANDLDPDGAPGLPLTIAEILDPPDASRGTLEIVGEPGSQSVRFEPAPDFAGVVSFAYRASDQLDLSEPAGVTLLMDGRPDNEPPIAVDDVARTEPGASVAIDVLANDIDPEGDPIRLVRFGQGENGTVTALGGGILLYAPAPGVAVDRDTFTYTITDDVGGIDEGQVTILVGDRPPPPVARPDQVETLASRPVVIDVLANDDLDPDTLIELRIEQPEDGRGATSRNLDDTLTFFPRGAFDGLEDGEVGVATFRYTLSQGGDASDSLVTVRVLGESNPDPRAHPVVEAEVELVPGPDVVAPVGAPGFPAIDEARAQPISAVNGVDPRHLTLAAGRDARITFLDEVAGDQHVLGVYRIGPLGAILEPEVVFPIVEASVLLSGEQVLLSDLYAPDVLSIGSRFGLFLIENGAALNQADFSSVELRFEGASGNGMATVADEAPPRLLFADGSAVEGRVIHTAGQQTDAGQPPANLLNQSGLVQTLSGVAKGAPGVRIAFEDRPLGRGDDDFNDTIVQVEILGGGLDERFEISISDLDSQNMSRAAVRITGGQPGDHLQLVGFEDADGDGILDATDLLGDGVALVEDGSEGRLVLDGRASIDLYEQILGAVDLVPGAGAEPRTVSFQVFDATGLPSEIDSVLVPAGDQLAVSA